MEQPPATTSPSELSDGQSLLNAEGTPGDDHSYRTEEPTGVDHINTSKTKGDTGTEKILGALLTDMSQEETPRPDNRDTTQALIGDQLKEKALATPGDTSPQENTGAHPTDRSQEETPRSDNRDTTQTLIGDQLKEKALAAQGDTSPQENTGAHPTDRGQEDPSRTDPCDTTPQGTPGSKDKDMVTEESKETQGITEPEATTPDPKGSGGAEGEEKQKEQERDKKEGDNTLLGQTSGEEEEAPKEVEVGEKEEQADINSSAQATEDTADETTSPAAEPPKSAEDPSSPSDQISSPDEEERRAEEPPQEGAGSPETSLEEGLGSPEVAEGGLKTGDTQPDGEVQGCAASVGASAEGAGPVETDKPPAPEKKKPVEKKRDVARSRTIPKSYGGQSRKAIMEKFGGPAAGPAPGLNVQRSTSFGASSVKNMLLEWCKAKTRDYEHVEIHNFSSSWSSGMAFCALVHKFFPEEFDYTTLDPKNRRKRADCAQLLEVDDMVRMRVPDSKCVYTYIQELYRSLVQMGLVKTKKQ